MKRTAIAAAGTTAAVILLAACGTSGPSAPPMIRVRGLVASGPLSGCHDLALEGAQVTITDSSGTVLATATLPLKPTPGKVDGITYDEFPYSVMVPPEDRYGIAVLGKSPYYVTRAEFTKGADLSC